MRKYFRHLVINFKVGVVAICLSLFYLVMAIFHFLHGIIPLKITEHSFWGLGSEIKEVKNNEIENK